jgi:hypothetical protein
MMEEDNDDNNPPLHQAIPQEELLEESDEGNVLLTGYRKK